MGNSNHNVPFYKRSLGVVGVVFWIVVIALAVLGFRTCRSCIRDINEDIRRAEEREAQIDASKMPEQRQREAELEEYDGLGRDAYMRPHMIEDAEWWVERKRQRYDEALVPGSGHDIDEARRDYEEAKEKLSRLYAQEQRYQQLRKKFQAPERGRSSIGVPSEHPLPPSVDVAIAKLSSDSPQERLQALEVLAGLSERVPSEAFEPLSRLATGENPVMRWMALFVLGEMPGRAKDRASIFVRAFRDESADVRRWAWVGLDTIAGDSAAALAPLTSELASVLADRKTTKATRAAVLCLLGDIGPAASNSLPFLRGLQDDIDEDQRFRAAVGLVAHHIESPLTPEAWAQQRLAIIVMGNEPD